MRKLKLFSLLVALFCATSLSVAWASPSQPAVGNLPKQEPAVNYYVVGTMNSWSPNDAYVLTANPEVDGEFMGEFTFAANAEIKVKGGDTWYPSSAGNYVITDAGVYTVYFRPNSDGGGNWHGGCIFVAKKIKYYVIGSMTGWDKNEAYLLTINQSSKWEYKGDFTFAAANEFKVIDENGAWYPAEAGNFVINEAGDYTVYFRPDGYGGEGWHEGYIYAAKKPEPQPAVKYYVIGSMNNWTTDEAYELTVNPEADWELMGDFTFAAADEFKVIDENGNWYPAAADNFVIDEAGDYTVYFRPDGAGGEGWYEGCIYVEMKPAVKYYVIGSMNGWTTDEAYILTVNPEAEWEYMGDFTFAANAQFKVIDGNGNWYPGGTDNDFIISEAGDYTVYFRPDGAGGEGWHEGCIYAALHPQGVDITANGDNGVFYSTFYDGSNKYLLPAGVEAYVATISGNDLLLTKIAQAGDVIPADNAVIFKSTVSSYTITPSDATPVAFSVTNNLQGTDEDINTVPANCYVLSGHSTDYSVTGIGFYLYEGTVLHAHKAYVVLSGSNVPKRMRFIFQEEQSGTGVENTEAENIRCTKVIENGMFYVIKNGVRYSAQGLIVKP